MTPRRWANSSRRAAAGASNTISYRFTNSTPDLSLADQRAAVRGALGRWAAVTPLTFVENSTGGDMLHLVGERRPMETATRSTVRAGSLAHCFYPPPGGGSLAGDAHFDEAETWSVNTPP